MNNELFKNANDSIKEIISRLEKHINESTFSGKVYIVGGCLRDLILGKQINDIDLAVEMENGGIGFATYITAKEKCYEMGKNPCVFPSYGTANFHLTNDKDLKGISIDCVQTRKNHSHLATNENTFGTIQDDMKNRDFTINSLCYNITTQELFDYNGTALDDIRKHILRTPIDAETIFTADPLRILRGIRLASQLNMGIDSKTWLGMIQNAHRITKVAQERISIEFSKLLLTDKPSIGIDRLKNCDILDTLIPDIGCLTCIKNDKTNGGTLYDFMLKVLDTVEPTLISRLSALFHNVGKVCQDKDIPSIVDKFSADVAADDLSAMKYPKDIIKKVSTAIRYHRGFSSCCGIPQDKKLRKFVNLTNDALTETFVLMHTYNLVDKRCQDKKRVLNILQHLEKMSEQEELNKVSLPINGNDIMKEFNIKGGPVIGILLEEVKDAYFMNPSITKDECFDIVEKKLKTLTV